MEEVKWGEERAATQAAAAADADPASKRSPLPRTLFRPDILALRDTARCTCRCNRPSDTAGRGTCADWEQWGGRGGRDHLYVCIVCVLFVRAPIRQQFGNNCLDMQSGGKGPCTQTRAPFLAEDDA